MRKDILFFIDSTMSVKIDNIVLVWAGGTGLSSLGFLLSDLWYTNIIGIDSSQSQITDNLEKAGVKMIFGHGTYEVQAGDVVIYSDACPTAPEVLSAQTIHATWVKGAQLPYSYFQFLGEISKYFETIAIAGTHGKSTTTALMTYTMSQCDPLFWLGILGALVPQLWEKNYWTNLQNPTIKQDLQAIFTRILTGKIVGWDETLRKKYRFAIEADEFNKHFLYLDVDHAIILNAELDHGEIYGSKEEYLATYVQFIQKVKDNVFALTGEVGIDHLKSQCTKIQCIEKKSINLPYIFGDHNQKNASLILALLEKILQKDIWNVDATDHTNISDITTEITESMAWFKWLRRRMEFLKTCDNGALIYTDYGHHPTEINAVYHAMREKYPTKKLIALFQPHQARRVLQFRPEFVKTMQQFDETIIYSIYIAREVFSELIRDYPLPEGQTFASVEELWELFAKECHGTYTQTFDDIITRLNTLAPDEVWCIFTAGNLDYQIRNEIV